MKKRLLSLTLAFMMCVGMLAGCGENAKPQESSGSPAQSDGTGSGEQKTPEEPETPAEPVEISLYMNAGDNQTSEKDVIDAMNAYSLDKIGVTIKFTAIPSAEYTEKISMELAAKGDIDMMWMASYKGFIDLCNRDALLDIGDLIPQYEGLYNVMPQMVWDSTRVNGKYYFVPNYKECFNAKDMYTPKALADTVKEKYGIDFNEIECNSFYEVGNFEEYLLACQKEGVEMLMPSLMGLSGYGTSDPYYEQLDYELFVMDRETHEVKFTLETPQWRETLELMEKWQKLGFFPEEMLASDFNATSYLSGGTYAICGWNRVPDGYNNLVDRYNVDAYLKEITIPRVTSSSATGAGWSISARTEKADACLRWLELLNTDTAFADLFTYGIEGTHYTRTEDGRIEKIADSGWGSYALWQTSNYKIASLMTTENPDKIKLYTEANDTAQPAILLGFRADFTDVSTEMTNIKALFSECQKMLDWGYYGMDKYDDLIAQFKAAGSDKVVAELQAQVDAFLADNQ
ncbi:MAG: ABC transporter substrate-binding protein [bacterium]|nr:ABC transporter substrate-binding protein [bacterium]